MNETELKSLQFNWWGCFYAGNSFYALATSSLRFCVLKVVPYVTPALQKLGKDWRVSIGVTVFALRLAV